MLGAQRPVGSRDGKGSRGAMGGRGVRSGVCKKCSRVNGQVVEPLEESSGAEGSEEESGAAEETKGKDYALRLPMMLR